MARWPQTWRLRSLLIAVVDFASLLVWIRFELAKRRPVAFVEDYPWPWS